MHTCIIYNGFPLLYLLFQLLASKPANLAYSDSLICTFVFTWYLKYALQSIFASRHNLDRTFQMPRNSDLGGYSNNNCTTLSPYWRGKACFFHDKLFVLFTHAINAWYLFQKNNSINRASKVLTFKRFCDQTYLREPHRRLSSKRMIK